MALTGQSERSQMVSSTVTGQAESSQTTSLTVTGQSESSQTVSRQTEFRSGRHRPERNWSRRRCLGRFCSKSRHLGRNWSGLWELRDWSGFMSGLWGLPDRSGFLSGLWGLPDQSGLWSGLWGLPDWSGFWGRLLGQQAGSLSGASKADSLGGGGRTRSLGGAGKARSLGGAGRARIMAGAGRARIMGGTKRVGWSVDSGTTRVRSSRTTWLGTTGVGSSRTTGLGTTGVGSSRTTGHGTTTERPAALAEISGGSAKLGISPKCLLNAWVSSSATFTLTGNTGGHPWWLKTVAWHPWWLEALAWQPSCEKTLAGGHLVKGLWNSLFKSGLWNYLWGLSCPPSRPPLERGNQWRVLGLARWGRWGWNSPCRWSLVVVNYLSLFVELQVPGEVPEIQWLHQFHLPVQGSSSPS